MSFKTLKLSTNPAQTSQKSDGAIGEYQLAQALMQWFIIKGRHPTKNLAIA
jgi:hypothetical protein